MAILNHLLRLLGIPGKQASKAAQVMQRLPFKEPKPIDLSPSQREQIAKSIAAFIENSTPLYAHAHARGSVARHNVLPLLLPPKPPDAIACPDCRGTGKLTFPHGSEHLADKLICYCGGIGWLPRSETPKNHGAGLVRWGQMIRKGGSEYDH